MIIRQATTADIPAITDIYNDAVLTTNATFDTRPKTVEERTTWFKRHNSRNPVIVSGENGAITGWASLSAWSDRAAYDYTAEISVYVRASSRGQGIGRKLMEEVLILGEKAGLHTILSRIVAGNDESIHLHESLGFYTVGTMKEVGFKNSSLLDVVILQKLYPNLPERELPHD